MNAVFQSPALIVAVAWPRIWDADPVPGAAVMTGCSVGGVTVSMPATAVEVRVIVE